MKKKITMIALVVALVAIMVVGGTLAYFTDKDMDTNVMTIGKVEIDQIEDFDEDTVILPYEDVVGIDLRNKVVTVKNTGTEPAYIRTLVAFEDTNGAADLVHAKWDSAFADEKLNAKLAADNVEVNGTSYEVWYVVYPDALDVGATSGESLQSVWADVTAGNDWANGVGGEYTVLVLSQAVQSTGWDAETAAEALDAAFPGINEAATVADWFATTATKGE